MLRVVGPASGTVEEQDAEVVATEVDASLQAPRASPDDDAVEGCLCVHSALYVHLLLLLQLSAAD